MDDWQPPADWLRIATVESHTGGEPFRVVVDGFPELRGDTMLARRRDARRRFDHLRRALVWEPRGHADMYGCLLTPPVTPGADFGVLFFHNDGFSTMCGHGVIALVTVAVETGMVARVEPESEVRLDTPAGPVAARARIEGGRVAAVSFRNVPSFVLGLDREVEVEGLGRLRYDLAFGGAFYAFVDAADAGLACRPEHTPELIDRGRRIKAAVAAADPPRHPDEPDLSFLYGVIFVEPAGGEVHSRNVCVFADGEVDRSPTGTGVSARLAIHHARGEIGLGEPLVVESLVGSRFTGRVVGRARCGGHEAVVPEIEGRAHLTGRGEHWLDPADPFRHGFLLR